MNTGNQDQMMGQVRQLVTALGTLAIVLGYARAEEVATWTTLFWQIAGPAMLISSVIWSWIANSPNGIIKSLIKNLDSATVVQKADVVAAVAQLPQVAKIALDESAPDVHTLNALTPGNVKVEK